MCQIVLYNNGLQAFERSAVVEGNSAIDLFFRVQDMPEVLKSLELSCEGTSHQPNFASLSSDGEGLQTCSYESNLDSSGDSGFVLPSSDAGSHIGCKYQSRFK